MKTRTSVLFLISAALALVAGCCDSSVTCLPNRQVRTAEVNGVSVYRLGQGMTTNTKAARLMVNVPGVCSTTCNGPVPPWFGLQQPPVAKAPVEYAARPETGRARAVSMIAPAPGKPGQVCAESTFSPIVCAPVPNMGACFTVPDNTDLVTTTTGAPAEPIEIYIPNGGTLEKLVDVPSAADVTPMVAEPTAKAEEPVQYVTETLVQEGPAEAAKTEATVTASAEKAPVVIAEPVDDMPPVFREGTTDKAAEEILSSAKRSGADLDGLAPVELPPELK